MEIIPQADHIPPGGPGHHHPFAQAHIAIQRVAWPYTPGVVCAFFQLVLDGMILGGQGLALIGDFIPPLDSHIPGNGFAVDFRLCSQVCSCLGTSAARVKVSDRIKVEVSAM